MSKGYLTLPWTFSTIDLLENVFLNPGKLAKPFPNTMILRYKEKGKEPYDAFPRMSKALR